MTMSKDFFHKTENLFITQGLFNCINLKNLEDNQQKLKKTSSHLNFLYL